MPKKARVLKLDGDQDIKKTRKFKEAFIKLMHLYRNHPWVLDIVEEVYNHRLTQMAVKQKERKNQIDYAYIVNKQQKRYNIDRGVIDAVLKALFEVAIEEMILTGKTVNCGMVKLIPIYISDKEKNFDAVKVMPTRPFIYKFRELKDKLKT